MPKGKSSKKKTESVKQDVMLYLKNLQDRLDKVEITLADIQLGADNGQSQEEQNFILTDSIVDEQITEAVIGLREDLNEFIRLIFSPNADISFYDSSTQDRISELRDVIEKIKKQIQTDVTEELKKVTLQKPTPQAAKASTAAKGAKKKSVKKRAKKKRST